MTEEENTEKWLRHLLGRRTIMAYIFTIATVVGFLKGMIDPADFVDMVMLVLAYYFMTRKDEERA